LLKGSGWFFKIHWRDQPAVHLLPHWNWPALGASNKNIDVWAYANTDAVELLLNGQSLGRQTMPKNGHAAWSVPYQRGALIARAYDNGKLVATDTVTTTGEAATIKLTSDRTAIKADGLDATVITVAITDSNGRIVPTANNLLHFTTQGPIRILGVGNGDPSSHEADALAPSYRFTPVSAWHLKETDTLDDAALLSGAIDSGWRDAFRWVPPGEALPPSARYMVLRSRFAKPELNNGDTVRLFLGDLTRDQKIYLNGEPLVTQREDGGLVADVAANKLRDSNDVAFVLNAPEGGAKKFIDTAGNGGSWLIVRTVSAMGTWQRSAFNGYARVIVQSTGAEGSAVVTATAPSLQSTKLTLKVGMH
jgi:beta-galactosidase